MRRAEGARARSVAGAIAADAGCVVHCRRGSFAALDASFAGAGIYDGRASAIRWGEGDEPAGKNQYQPGEPDPGAFEGDGDAAAPGAGDGGRCQTAGAG